MGSRTLIICEKPSAARDIAGALGRFAKKEGYLENGKHLVSWAFGHLLELAAPHEYDKALTAWRLETLPIIPKRFRLKPTRDAQKQLRVLGELLNSRDVGVVVNACDAGREGELIFRRIYDFTGCRKSVKRLWLSEATLAAIRDTFQRLLEGWELDNLAQADWLVGINATRAFSVRHNAVLTVGRVQTPILALLVVRDEEIGAFKSAAYWEVWAEFEAKGGSYKGK